MSKEKITDLDEFGTVHFVRPYFNPETGEPAARGRIYPIDQVWEWIHRYPEWAAMAVNRARKIWKKDSASNLSFPSYIQHPFVDWLQNEIKKP